MFRCCCLLFGLALSLPAAWSAALPAATPVENTPGHLQAGTPGFKPLSDILALARRYVPGKVIEVELEMEDDSGKGLRGRWIYEVEVLTPDNRVVELEFDALTGRLVAIEGAPWPAGVPRVRP